MKNAIPYGLDIFEVDDSIMSEWGDALERVGSDSNAMEWATYDVLIGNGYFVSQPKEPRPANPDPAKVLEERERARNEDPGFRDLPHNYPPDSSREPLWTQSRILAERDKLLREREKVAKLKEDALQAKIKQMQWANIQKAQKSDFTFRNPDGTPYTIWDWAKIGIVAFMILSLIIALLR